MGANSACTPKFKQPVDVISESKKPPCQVVSLMASAPTEIRTPVLALKGLRPGPLDDGGEKCSAFFVKSLKLRFKLYALWEARGFYHWPRCWSSFTQIPRAFDQHR